AFVTPIEKTRQLAFTPRNTIDGQAFDGDVEQRMEVGTAEDWTVSNNTAQLHIYHIHVNPFFVTSINGQELPADSPLRRWQDTLGIPVREDGRPGSARFSTRFEKFTGKFVIHCHVLAHEDAGMMQIVEVTDTQ
ncbi:MAG: multicopper oxidase domain-containing protein, partial [Pseudomonadota bacterium]